MEAEAGAGEGGGLGGKNTLIVGLGEKYVSV